MEHSNYPKLQNLHLYQHCVKSVRIWSYFGPHFSRITPNSDTFYTVQRKLSTKTAFLQLQSMKNNSDSQQYKKSNRYHDFLSHNFVLAKTHKWIRNNFREVFVQISGKCKKYLAHILADLQMFYINFLVLDFTKLEFCTGEVIRNITCL